MDGQILTTRPIARLARAMESSTYGQYLLRVLELES